jgi:hypothetical protein
MRIVRFVLLGVLAGLLAGGPAPLGVASPPSVPTLVAIRAAHHPGFDRIVFQFAGGLPTGQRVEYVDVLRGDGSGLPIPVAGRAILSASFDGAQAHDSQGPTVSARKAFALPNIMATVRAGDFEAVTTYGIGLAKRTPFTVSRLHNPSRVVIDVRASFPTVDRRVFFFDRDNFVAGTGPFFTWRTRPVRPGTPAVGVLDRLFAGPVASERSEGLRLLGSHATGFADLAIADGVARVRLTGGCNSDGSTVTIAGEIMPTLRQFASVTWVKILDPSGHTEVPDGHTDSIPACLEP